MLLLAGVGRPYTIFESDVEGSTELWEWNSDVSVHFFRLTPVQNCGWKYIIHTLPNVQIRKVKAGRSKLSPRSSHLVCKGILTFLRAMHSHPSCAFRMRYWITKQQIFIVERSVQAKRILCNVEDEWLTRHRFNPCISTFGIEENIFWLISSFLSIWEIRLAAVLS